MVHNLAVRGEDLVSEDLDAGATAELDISDLDPGTYEVYCTIPGHTESGMSAQLDVGSDGAAAERGPPATRRGASHADHTPTAAEGAEQDQAMIESVMAFPARPRARATSRSPDVLADGTKRFELTASVIDWEVRPGEIVKAWAYNGMVPGPRIDLDVGDHVEVELTNQLPIGTDIHWHGIDVPNDQDGVSPITQDLVTSGETYTYRVHRHRAGDRHVPRPRPRPRERPQRPVRHDVRRRRAEPGRSDDLGHRDPRRPRPSPRTSRWSSTTPA